MSAKKNTHQQQESLNILITRSPGLEEQTLIHSLLTDWVPATIEKCLQEPYVRHWGANIQRDIMSMVTAVASLSKLRMQAAALQPMTAEGAEELLALLQSLSIAMQPTCNYHLLHKYASTSLIAHYQVLGGVLVSCVVVPATSAFCTIPDNIRIVCNTPPPPLYNTSPPLSISPHNLHTHTHVLHPRSDPPTHDVAGLPPPGGTWTRDPASPLVVWSPSVSNDSPIKPLTDTPSPVAVPGFSWLRQLLEWFGAEDPDQGPPGGFSLVTDVCSALLRDTQSAGVDDLQDARVMLGHVETLLCGLRATAPLLQPVALGHVLQVRTPACVLVACMLCQCGIICHCSCIVVHAHTHVSYHRRMCGWGSNYFFATERRHVYASKLPQMPPHPG